MTSFFLDQHGCAKNQVDGELIISHLVKSGLRLVDDASVADIIIINSCGFIESAKKESINAVIAAKASYPNAKIVLAGCLAERYADLLKTELPDADAIFGTGDISLITEVIDSLKNNNHPVIRPPQKNVCSGERDTFLSFPGSAFVKITEGCNNCCTFCAIPIIRGELRSRSIPDIVNEIETLLKHGIFEINLVGQDLAAYGSDFPLEKSNSKKTAGDSTDNSSLEYFSTCIAPPCGNRKGSTAQNKSALPELLQAISCLQGDFWIRLLYIHPDHFSSDLLSIIKADKRILPYFDIPFQSGDNDIIKAMNRKGSSSYYLSLAEKIRKTLPDAVLRTTFLTGFPGETDESFRNTSNFLQKLQPDWSGCFEYSKEDGTPAFSMKKQVAKKIARKRAEELQEIQTSITETRISRHTGQIYRAIIEEIIEGDEGLAIGRVWFQAPEVDGAAVIRYDKEEKKQSDIIKPGNIVFIKITGISGIDLDGVLQTDSRLQYCGR